MKEKSPKQSSFDLLGKYLSNLGLTFFSFVAVTNAILHLHENFIYEPPKTADEINFLEEKNSYRRGQTIPLALGILASSILIVMRNEKELK
jgi:hypothetical protein